MIDFILNNKIDLIKALKEYEMTGKQTIFNEEMFMKYLHFISKFDGLNGTIRYRMGILEKKPQRIIYNKDGKRVYVDINKVDGINYGFKEYNKGNFTNKQDYIKRKWKYKGKVFNTLISLTTYIYNEGNHRIMRRLYLTLVKQLKKPEMKGMFYDYIEGIDELLE